MEFYTVGTHTIDIFLVSTLAIVSVTFHPLTNIDSFILQLHHSQRYYLEIMSNIGSKSINKLDNVPATLIRIIILGTEDGYPPNHVSIEIVKRDFFDLLNIRRQCCLFVDIVGCLHPNTITKNYAKSI